MFILYAILIGTLLGVAMRGDPRHFSLVTFHWRLLVVAALVFQVVLFAPAIAARVGDLGPLLYVGSTVAVLAAVLRNHAIPGMPIVALGSASNLAAILANGGYMPTGAEAAAALGAEPPEVYSNSAFVDHPALEPLTDIFALPSWLPFNNVFSIGDVLIGVGVALAITQIMRGRGLRPAGQPVAEPVGLERVWRAVRGSLVPGGATTHPQIGLSDQSTSSPYAHWDSRRSVPNEDRMVLGWHTVQGKPIVR